MGVCPILLLRTLIPLDPCGVVLQGLFLFVVELTVCRFVLASSCSKQVAGGGGPSTNAPPVTTRYKKFLPFN